MKQSKEVWGHVIAIFTIFVWGITYISTKVLLRDFAPIEILLMRFVMGYLALWIVSPKLLKVENKKQELMIAAAGLCGLTLYYLLENIALIYTMASNVGVIISVAPFFTALIGMKVFKEKNNLNVFFIIGFVIAMVGIAMLNFSGVESLQINPIGDVLALAAAVVWAIYSNIIRRVSEYGYSTLQVTKRTFFYGIMFMIPCALKMGFSVSLETVLKPQNIGNIIFLGLGASALCFVTWNFAVKVLGAVKTSVYIYLTPVVTVTTSVIILHEKITGLAAAGIILTLLGLICSSYRGKEKESVANGEG